MKHGNPSTPAPPDPLDAAATPAPRLLNYMLLMTLAIGIACTALLFRYFVAADQARLQQSVQRATQALVEGGRQSSYLTPTLDLLIGMFAGIQAEAGAGAGAAVDSALLQRHLWREPPAGMENTSLEYLPRILASERDNPQAWRARIGNPENSAFPLLDLVEGVAVPAAARDEYFPILLEVAPEAPQAIIGLDPAADPLIALAMTQARDTGELASHTRFPLARSDATQVTRYFQALYDTPQIPATVEERRAHHVGFISAVTTMSAETVLAFQPESYQGIETSFLPLAGDSSTMPAIDLPAVVHGYYAIEDQYLGVVARASPSLQDEAVSPTRWWTLGLGLLLTLWMASTVLWSNLQKQRIVQVVEQRTRSLGAANAALRDSETRYRMLANNISDVIYTHDMDGICTYISPSIRAQLGFEENDYLGKPIHSHLLPESAERTRVAIERTVRAYHAGKTVQLGTYPHELETFCRDGSTKPVEVTISGVYNDAGKLVAFMGVMRDVSARKQAERERERLQDAYRQSQKLEAIGTLAGGIAHDFNNLLTAVIGHTDLLKLEFTDRNPARHSLDVIEMAALRAKDLTTQLLGFARKGQYQLVPVEINQVVTDVMALMERTIDRNIVVSCRAHPQNPAVMGDPGQISQIFLNLALNARDAMPQGGKLEFDVAIEQLDDAFCKTHIDLTPGSYCVISVRDTGSGIAADKLEHIFEPFFTDKPDGQGTGLGLAMVYGVTRNHNGTVTVDSTPGQGSTFRVYLPAESPAVASAPTPPVRNLVQGNGHVLLIDDQDIVRQIGRRMLQQLGYRVTLAEDGLQGLELYREHWQDVDMVIIDIMMPNMGGLECLDALHAINPAVNAVLASGFSRDSVADKLKERHILGFLQKPFRLQELSDLLASLQA